MHVEAFNPEIAVQYAEALVHQDEVERALLVLDNVPAYYRDNPTPAMSQLRSEILGALCTPHAYMASGLDAKVQPEISDQLLSFFARSRLVEAEVSRYNQKGVMPHIVDMGPGGYFIPLGLKKKGYRFSYWDIACDSGTQAVAHPLLEGFRRESPPPEGPVIFLALEIIEHLPSPSDIAIEALRHSGGWPERVHLSTPRYTFDRGIKDWRKKCGLPHLRAYTPTEFMRAAERMFPFHQWQIYHSEIVSLRGMRNDRVEDITNPLVTS